MGVLSDNVIRGVSDRNEGKLSFRGFWLSYQQRLTIYISGVDGRTDNASKKIVYSSNKPLSVYTES